MADTVAMVVDIQEEIGKMMFITKRYAVRKHKEALAEFQKVLDFKETGE